MNIKYKAHLSFVVFAALGSAADIQVPAGGDFQNALNVAQPGDTITLAAGAVYGGNFSLPVKTGASFITIRGSHWQSMPPAGVRIAPVHFASLPKLVTTLNLPIVTASFGAHHYRFDGIEFRPISGSFIDDLVRCGAGETAITQLPYEIEFAHVYVHGDPAEGGKRGLAANCRSLVVRDSYFSDFKSSTRDAQAIAGWNGPGPFTIVNNYLEATGENIAFGGAVPTIPGLVPSDIVIKGNHLFKPLTWKVSHPSYTAPRWIIKNHIEFKIGRRVTVEGNILENSWTQGDQQGFSIVLYPETSVGVTWTVVEDISITRNLFRYIQGGVNLIGGDPYTVPITQQGVFQRITVRDNVFEKIFSEAGLSSPALLFRVVNGAIDSTLDHNTAFNDGGVAVFDSASLTLDRFLIKRIHITNNIVLAGDCATFCGFEGRGTARGIPTLNFWNPGGVVDRNVMVGGALLNNPPVTYTPPTVADVGFVNFAGGDFRLAASSPFKNAGTDGRDPGADIPAVNTATLGVRAGNPNAASCAISLYPPNAVFPAAGGTGSIAVSAPANCPWSVQPPAPWLSWTGPLSGMGNSNISYSVAPLPLGGVKRAGVLSVGSRKIGVTQTP